MKNSRFSTTEKRLLFPKTSIFLVAVSPAMFAVAAALYGFS
jgi:hypothetical protein